MNNPTVIAAARLVLLLATAGLVGAPAALAEAQDPQAMEYFEQHIRPALVQHCYKCHSAEADDVGGNLLLDSQAGMLEGGDSGPVLVAGDPKASLILEAILYESYEMPPEGKLPDEVIGHFRKWIAMGAPDPRTEEVALVRDEPALPAEDLWSLEPLADVPPPDVNDKQWPHTEIDRFVLARLEASGIAPVADADPERLLRRVHFDLIGLPPSPADVAAFREDPSLAHFSEIVDRLLASPQFGERWGRHWLDVARFAESNGKDRDVLMPQAWRYRDYVIDAFNADIPFDQFIAEQLAGDLLPADSPEDRDRKRVATGFLAIGAKSLTGNTQMDLIDEQIDVTSRAFLGLTASCARCHDHKFDPIPTKDYYALAGVFLSTETQYGGGFRNQKGIADRAKQLLVLGDGFEQKLKQLTENQKEIDKLNKERQSLGKKLKQAEQRANKKKDDAKLAKAVDDFKARQKSLNEEINRLRNDLPELDLAVGVKEKAKPQDCAIHIRGERNKKGEVVPRGFLSCVDLEVEHAVEADTSGRLQLAQWIADPANPLTSRVVVNRIWQHLMGCGIVDTVDNFGVNGSKPTHPELLDYLARQMIEGGWSHKAMIRKIVLSRTYRLSSKFDEASFAADPGNTLYWRMSRRRLEAEAIRDAMLAASGQLDLQRPKASAVAKVGDGELGRGVNTGILTAPTIHRSVYLPIVRGLVPEMLKVFDYPEPSNVQGLRDTTNVPAQSLFLMNNKFVLEQAQHMAERVQNEAKDDAARVELAWQLAFGRLPSEAESQRALEFVSTAESKTDSNDNEKQTPWTTLCHGLLASAEFRYLD